MIRTQIYLTEQQRFALNKLSSTSGKKQSELTREAVDTLIFKLNQKKSPGCFGPDSGNMERQCRFT